MPTIERDRLDSHGGIRFVVLDDHRFLYGSFDRDADLDLAIVDDERPAVEAAANGALTLARWSRQELVLLPVWVRIVVFHV
jgi:hypothetical protein